MNLTAVIPTRNDPLLFNTVNSLRQGKADLDIIVVDDASDSQYRTLAPAAMVSADFVIYNEKRLGPGPSRQLGADKVDNGWIMFCDSHMTFPHDWYSHVMRHLKASAESEIWGCHFVTDVIADSMWHDSRKIGGADFYFWRHHGDQFTFGGISPRRPKARYEYLAPCLIGGCYFIHKNWFEMIDGFRPLVGYGSEEPWMSWNTWIRGGTVNIMGDVDVVHHHQTATSFHFSMVPELSMNRYQVLRAMLTQDQFSHFLSWLPTSPMEKQMIETLPFVKSNTLADYKPVCKSFGLQTIEEAIMSMMRYNQSLKITCNICRSRKWIINQRKFAIDPCWQCNSDGSIKPKYGFFSLEAQ